MIPVVWLPPGDQWDQSMLRATLDGAVWGHRWDFEHVAEVPVGAEGVVVVVPARYHDPAAVNEILRPLQWALVLLTSDEESLFLWRDLDHPCMRLWVMTPRPDRHSGEEAAKLRFIGEGWSPGTPDVLAAVGDRPRPLNWFFAGQVTHARREELVRTLGRLRGGELVQTPGFLQGLDRPEYLRKLASSRVALCPSGPATPDSFRLYEALEAGCLPVVDSSTPEGWTGYWDLLFGGHPPFPVVEQWSEFRRLLPGLVAGYPVNANRVQAWWQQFKRSQVQALNEDLLSLGARQRSPTPDDLITVVIPTSPIESHPEPDVIAETIHSIRERLPSAEIVVVADGVREEQEDKRADYEEYLRRLLWLSGHRWSNVLPVILDGHVHQANAARQAMRHVRTPLVLFVEHDTPLLGEIPWEGLSAAVLGEQANAIRLHHEANVLKPHQHLMLDVRPRDVAGVPLLRTVQWSQRPHLARADWYSAMLDAHFGDDSRTMIEDVLHGVVDYAWRTQGFDGWDRWRLWMYAPPGDMKRSTHSDGRAGKPKYDDRFVFAYGDGVVPPGAPAPTAARFS